MKELNKQSLAEMIEEIKEIQSGTDKQIHFKPNSVVVYGGGFMITTLQGNAIKDIALERGYEEVGE